MTPSVQVLLSSYNGEQYIYQQIESIYAQKNVDTHLLIRDDGSTDDTVNLLKKYQDKENTKIIKGYNCGSTKSFFELINNADSRYSYFALSDQDDVWDDDKLSIAIRSIEKYKNAPAIYSGNTRLVDSNLNLIKEEDDNPVCTLGSALVKNYATGCTIVFNNKLLQLLQYKLPNNIKNHDWWINLVALANNGVSVYDKTSHMCYRQHGNNVIGAPTSPIRKWKSRLKKFLSDESYHRDVFAADLLDIYGDNINTLNKQILLDMKNAKKNKMQVLKDRNLKTSSLSTDVSFSLLVLFNKV